MRFAQPTVPNGIVTPPKVLAHQQAFYSNEARQRGIEGSVIVQARFDELGNMTVLKVVKGLGYGLDEAAVTALKWWRFAPAMKDGQPVAAIAEIEVPFYLVNENMLRAMREIERMRRQLDEAIALRDKLSKVGPSK